MRYSYRCDSCGCYLDPGEGNVCEECQEKSRKRSQEQRRISEMVQLGHDQQYEFALGGTV